MTDQEESLIAQVVLYYSSNLTALSRTSVIDIANTVLEAQGGTKIRFMALTGGLLDGFIKQHEILKVVALQSVDASHTDACTSEYICEHIARIITVVSRYNISTPKSIFDIDESGLSFKYMTGRKIDTVLDLNCQNNLNCCPHSRKAR